jgi:hypothetical protein
MRLQIEGAVFRFFLSFFFPFFSSFLLKALFFQCYLLRAT